jgi:hypothetical protein
VPGFQTPRFAAEVWLVSVYRSPEIYFQADRTSLRRWLGLEKCSILTTEFSKLDTVWASI